MKFPQRFGHRRTGRNFRRSTLWSAFRFDAPENAIDRPRRPNEDGDSDDDQFLLDEIRTGQLEYDVFQQDVATEHGEDVPKRPWVAETRCSHTVPIATQPYGSSRRLEPRYRVDRPDAFCERAPKCGCDVAGYARSTARSNRTAPAVGWTLLQRLFQLHIQYAADPDIAGALGAILVLLVWLYFGSYVVLIGAVVNCAPYDERAG